MRINSNQSSRSKARSGVYVGGIGAGGFEARPDGKYYTNHIFNDWLTDKQLDMLFLYEHKKQTYVLSLDEHVIPGRVIKGVKSIKYTGEFPKVKLSFPGLPVEIEFMSFFIPGDVKNSSLPSFMCRVKGQGKLCMLFSSDSFCDAQAENQFSFLKSDKGEIQLYSPKGKVFFDEKEFTGLNTMVSRNKIPGKPFNKSKYKGQYYAGAYFEGNINNEIIVTWHYPDFKDWDDSNMGHYYSNYFSSAKEVMDYVIKNKQMLKNKTEKFYNSIFKSKLPQYLKESYAEQFSCFVKQSWLTKDKKFGVWEGSCCCCGLQTTDVAYYGSWLYVNLFPELEKSAIRLTAGFQRKEDGWIAHYFPGTFNRIDEYRRKDMNMQFCLMVYRNYYLWKDKEFLREMYPSLKKALLGVYGLDTDGDLLPDISGPDQTFDAWDWKGASAYLSGLWLATLRVGMEAGKIMGDDELSNKCKQDFETVKTNMIKKLWNGKHFILWNDGKIKDEASLLDALSGDWFCVLSGLGHILPESMIESHLKICLKQNRKKMDSGYMKEYSTPGEKGWCYINGGYKDNKKVCFQQYEPWTGIEFAFAVHLYIMGMKKEALRVIKDVEDRKASCGMSWNHIECGGDYFRPMVIGALYELMTGRLK
ncbi:MAG: hypothetical protein A2252_11810 [Elusimicrobia bacterium RIFOXYA2_FULL_39_19]|nr:MAG: hypothetical protein A2252_11810 [Elusimicrobia bacterium RIFOXYA2_FULL_39_19]